MLAFLCLITFEFVTKMPEVFSIGQIDFSQLKDGTYKGYCDNGLVTARVFVTVENQSVTAIELTEHNNGLGKAAEVIPDHIIGAQSLQVDVISGATYSSVTILKAVEAALVR